MEGPRRFESGCFCRLHRWLRRGIRSFGRFQSRIVGWSSDEARCCGRLCGFGRGRLCGLESGSLGCEQTRGSRPFGFELIDRGGLLCGLWRREARNKSLSGRGLHRGEQPSRCWRGRLVVGSKRRPSRWTFWSSRGPRHRRLGFALARSRAASQGVLLALEAGRRTSVRRVEALRTKDAHRSGALREDASLGQISASRAERTRTRGRDSAVRPWAAK